MSKSEQVTREDSPRQSEDTQDQGLSFRRVLLKRMYVCSPNNIVRAGNGGHRRRTADRRRGRLVRGDPNEPGKNEQPKNFELPDRTCSGAPSLLELPREFKLFHFAEAAQLACPTGRPTATKSKGPKVRIKTVETIALELSFMSLNPRSLIAN